MFVVLSVALWNRLICAQNEIALREGEIITQIEELDEGGLSLASLLCC